MLKNVDDVDDDDADENNDVTSDVDRHTAQV